jgi:hypothetical protein
LFDLIYSINPYIYIGFGKFPHSAYFAVMVSAHASYIGEHMFRHSRNFDLLTDASSQYFQTNARIVP